MPPIPRYARDSRTGRLASQDEPAQPSTSTAEPAAADVQNIMHKFGTFDKLYRLVSSFIKLTSVGRLCGVSDN